MSFRAFVSEYPYISDVLTNTVVVKYNNLETSEVALWDTGASITFVSREVVKSLNLIPIGKEDILTPSGLFTSNTYLLDILLPNDIIIPNILVQDSEIGAQGIGVLIGMDIINQGDFSVSNFNGKTVFTYRKPSRERIDYVSNQK